MAAFLSSVLFLRLPGGLRLEMFLWRLSNYDDLSGRGGLVASGRWHNRGRSVVYCSESVRVARIEIEQGLGLPDYLWPDSFKLLCVEAPASVKIEDLAASDLPADWRENVLVTRRLGDAWLRANTAPLLRVPSARADGWNYLINPAHRYADFLTIRSVYDLEAIRSGVIDEA